MRPVGGNTTARIQDFDVKGPVCRTTATLFHTNRGGIGCVGVGNGQTRIYDIRCCINHITCQRRQGSAACRKDIVRICPTLEEIAFTLEGSTAIDRIAAVYQVIRLQCGAVIVKEGDAVGRGKRVVLHLRCVSGIRRNNESAFRVVRMVVLPFIEQIVCSRVRMSGDSHLLPGLAVVNILPLTGIDGQCHRCVRRHVHRTDRHTVVAVDIVVTVIRDRYEILRVGFVVL